MPPFGAKGRPGSASMPNASVRVVSGGNQSRVVELQLPGCCIPDAHRRTVGVAASMIEFDLVDVVIAVEVVQR